MSGHYLTGFSSGKTVRAVHGNNGKAALSRFNGPVPVNRAYKAGKEDGRLFRKEREEGASVKMAANGTWTRWYAKHRKVIPERFYRSVSQSYLQGFCRGSGEKTDGWIPLPTPRPVAAILSVRNEEKTIHFVLDELAKLPLAEIIVVVSGSDDDSYRIAREHIAKPVVVHYDEALGYDVTRALGAKLAKADILLFLGGDAVIPAHRFLPFIDTIDRGTDVALNDIRPFLLDFYRWDAVTIMKEFVNCSLARPDLGANSLTSLPHALSRRAVEEIGYRNLAVPPLAQALAIQKGLRVEAPASVSAVKSDLMLHANADEGSPVAELILGDHLEALHQVMELRGERLRYPDTMRKREYAGREP